MQITFNKHTALALLRMARKQGLDMPAVNRNRVNVIKPDPTPRARWSKSLFERIFSGEDDCYPANDLFIARAAGGSSGTSSAAAETRITGVPKTNGMMPPRYKQAASAGGIAESAGGMAASAGGIAESAGGMAALHDKQTTQTDNSTPHGGQAASADGAAPPHSGQAGPAGNPPAQYGRQPLRTLGKTARTHGNERWQHPLLPRWLGAAPIQIAVSHGNDRLRTQGVENTVYNGQIPEGAFVSLGNGLFISSPELIFVELASIMRPLELIMLGHELCGSFCRDAKNPYDGPVEYSVKPVTSVSKLGAFIEKARYVRGVKEARAVLPLLNDNAWSPTESLIAAVLVAGIDDFGLDMGPLVLNPRLEREHMLPGSKESRVPDIMIADTAVGINYDGLMHLDLNSIVKAALNLYSRPGELQAQRELDQAIATVRKKALDDIRRNRELASNGLTVFPMTKEDLYTTGGMEAILEQVIATIEAKTSMRYTRQKRALKQSALCKDRHRVILSLLPGRTERDVNVARYIEGFPVSESPVSVNKCWIEL